MSGIRDIWLYANNILRSARQMVNDDLKPLNLSSAEGNILLHLLTQEGIFQQEDLVDQLEISKPAISRALDSLETKGYITRKRDPDDKRANQIFVTQKAQDIGPKIEQVYSEIFALAATTISEEEIRVFIEVFERVSQSFSAARVKKRLTAQIKQL
jgi:DNA-binding MarR family transcriptional regulator